MTSAGLAAGLLQHHASFAWSGALHDDAGTWTSLHPAWHDCSSFSGVKCSHLVQVEADIKPFRGMLLGLFFVSTGASLDVRLMLHEPWIVIALLGGLLAVKVGIIGSVAPFFGLTKYASGPGTP